MHKILQDVSFETSKKNLKPVQQSGSPAFWHAGE